MVAKKLFLGKLMEHIGKSERARTCTHGYAREILQPSLSWHPIWVSWDVGLSRNMVYKNGNDWV
jgi:hypothetical protein